MEKLKRKWKRMAAIALAVFMVSNTIDMSVFAESAAESTQTEICDHHMEHTEDCGYSEGTEESPCTHVHDEACGYDTVSGNETCSHVHDEACGYVEAVEGTPCSYVCESCTEENSAEQQTVTCTCAEKCTEKAVDTECVVCSAEGFDFTACNGQEKAAVAKTITEWSWNDDYEIIDTEYQEAVIPGTSPDHVADFDTIIGMLPMSITATVNDIEENIDITWSCEDYPAEGAYNGSYIFKAALPEEYTLSENPDELTVTVILGQTQMMADGDHASHDGIGTAWNETTKLPENTGSYYLTADVTLTDVWSPANGTKLCLNGHTITAASGNYAVNVDTGVTFTLTDCSDSTTAGYIDEYGLWKAGAAPSGETGATAHNLTGGVITGGSNASRGCIYVGGTFNMNRGNIAGNAESGGVMVASGGTFNLSGGAVCGNQTDNNGGGVFVSQNGTFTMPGGEVSYNTSNSNGGGVYLNGSGALFQMSGGKVSHNKQTESNTGYGGGGIYVGKGSNAVVNGNAEVTSNTSEGDGGGIYIYENGKTELAGAAQVTENQAISNSYGGGIYVKSGGSLTGDGTIKISQNKASDGGGIYSEGTVTLTNASVSENVSTNGSGGGIRVKNGELTLSKTVIDSNTSNEYGGGIYVGGTSVSIKDSSLKNNTAERRGGGIYIQYTTVNITETAIEGNKVTYDANGCGGGGVYVSYDATLELSGGTVKNNEATANTYNWLNGGGIYLYNSSGMGYGTLRLSGDPVISGNKLGNKDNNLYIQKNDTVTIGNTGADGSTEYLTNGAYIGITHKNSPSDASPITLTGRMIRITALILPAIIPLTGFITEQTIKLCWVSTRPSPLMPTAAAVLRQQEKLLAS